jgi:peptidoglycan/LPS O-acetylase OafA/YrhL
MQRGVLGYGWRMLVEVSGQGERSGALDALRGLAITFVVCQHWLGLPIGWAGVDLFFVLSGYLIGGILIDNRTSRRYFSTFYVRRAFRILPLYLLFLAVILPTYGSGISLWHYLTFTQNFAQARVGMTGEMPEVTWSLAVEEQFYLLLPILVRLLPPSVLLRVAAYLVAAAPLARLLIVLVEHNGWAPNVLLPGRMDALFLGVSIACIVRKPGWAAAIQRNLWTVWVTCIATVAALALLGWTDPGRFFNNTPWGTFGYSLYDLACGCLLLGTAASGWQPSSQNPLRLLGIGSYSVYLFHRPVLSAITDKAPHAPLPAYLLATTLLTLLSVCCWFLVERPLIKWSRVKWHYGQPRRHLTLTLAKIEA